MLRKISHIVMALLLMVSTSGVTVAEHFCEGVLVSASILTTPEPCDNMPKGCCEDKRVHYEVKDDFIDAVHITKVKAVTPVIAVPVFYFFYQQPVQLMANSRVEFYNTSPPKDISTRLSFIQSFLC
jgi:hypothetical protein